jgi:hypothetical protein
LSHPDSEEDGTIKNEITWPELVARGIALKRRVFDEIDIKDTATIARLAGSATTAPAAV